MRKLGFASLAILTLVGSASADSLTDQLNRELFGDLYQPHRSRSQTSASVPAWVQAMSNSTLTVLAWG